MSKQTGFTLIELMVVVVIIAIIAAFAIPSYQSYVRRANAAQAQQNLQQISVLLERHRVRNFSFKGFNLSTQQDVTVPLTYSFDLKDGADTTKALTDLGASGRSWVIKAITTDNQNYNFLMTSTGVRCKNKTAANVSYTGCGTGSEPW